MQKQISEFIYQLKKEYSWLNFTGDELTDIIKMVLKKYPDVTFTNFTNYYQHYLRMLVSNKLTNDFVNIVNKYMENNFGNIDDKRSAINALDKLESFFYDNFFTPSVDQYIDILNNPVLVKAINYIIPQETKTVTDDYLNNLTKNDSLLSLIEAYCISNKIDIIESEIPIEYNISTMSSEALFYASLPKKTLTIQEERELFECLKQGDTSAREKIIIYNMRLVANIARNNHSLGVEFLDKVQDGYFGLNKAIDKFDLSRGYKFSTYATWWIKQSILRGIANKSRGIRIPIHMGELLRKLKAFIEEFQEKNGRMPTDEESCAALDISKADLKLLQMSVQDISSLNTPINNEKENTELGDLISDSHSVIEESAFSTILAENVDKLIEEANLTDREKTIIYYRFGFVDGEEHTLEEVGKIYHVTRERIRQIESKIITKLTYRAERKHLQEFITDSNKPSTIARRDYTNLSTLFPDSTIAELKTMFYKLPQEDKNIWNKKNGLNVFTGPSDKTKLTNSEYYAITKKIYLDMQTILNQDKHKPLISNQVDIPESKDFSEHKDNLHVNVDIKSIPNHAKARIKVKVK